MKHTHSALLAVALALIFAATAQAAPAKAAVDSAIKIKADLAKRLKVQASEIKFIEAKPVTWPDGSLGLPEVGKSYIQVLTPGSRVTLEVRNSRYLYTTSAKAFRYGGPASMWSYSMLYLQPVADEPNLNSDLYQTSLLGTNSTRLISGVSDYYPQEKGALIIKRRTSRSFHDLLHFRAGEAAKARVLHTGVDFGQAALNSAQDKWAAFVKPSMGAPWAVVTGLMSGDREKLKTLPLPEGVKPGQIAWSDDKLIILANKGDRTTGYEISPNATALAWKEVGAHLFPDSDKYMLNKSETLEIDQTTVDGKPAVEVARVWFTGDRNLVARIPGLTLRGYDLLGPYAIVWGEKGSSPAAYAVDIATDEVIPGISGVGRNLKPFAHPPLRSPLSKP